MTKNKDRGGLIAIKGRKRIYAKPLKPGREPPKREKAKETKS